MKLGNVIIGPSNNLKRMHGIPMTSNKRWKHERKDLSKKQRVRFHAMLRAGCDIDFIKKCIEDDENQRKQLNKELQHFDYPPNI